MNSLTEYVKSWVVVCCVVLVNNILWSEVVHDVIAFCAATESMVCSGGNKRGQFDTDLPDDASPSGATYDSCRQTPTRGRPFKLQITSPRKSKLTYPRSVVLLQLHFAYISECH